MIKPLSVYCPTCGIGPGWPCTRPSGGPLPRSQVWHKSRIKAATKPMLLYISGPITGIEDDNRPAFAAAEIRLTDAGYRVINPHKIGPPAGYQDGLEWSDYLRGDLAAILNQGVEGIATLPKHHYSRGARLECHVALELDIPVGPEQFWLSIKKEK